jgi:hypothetical protein
MQPKLGIIVGGGSLPPKIIEACQASGRSFFVIGIEGFASQKVLEGVPHCWVSISKAGTGFRVLKEEQVNEVVMIGNVQIPSLIQAWPDFHTLIFFTKIAFRSLFNFVGDNGILVSFTRELEKRGIKIIGVQEILENLLAPRGLLGSVPVPKELLSDINLGVESAFDLGKRDLGQAVIVKAGIVIIKEGKNGTRQMIQDSQKIISIGRGGILVKLKKPGQDRRLDMPTIGPNTINEASKAGLSGIIIQANETIVIDIEKVIKIANENGIFIKALDLN